MNEQTKGTIIMAFSAVFFSLGGIFIKLVPWSAFATNGVRCLIGAMVFSIYMITRKRKLSINLPTFLGALCLIGTTNLYNLATKLTTAGNAIILQYTSPIFIILLSCIFFHKKPEKAEIIASCAVFFGILWFFIDGISSGNILGNLLALTAGLTVAGLYVLKLNPKTDMASMIFFGLLFSGILCVPTLARETVFTPEIWCYVIILGVFQLGVAYILFFRGLSRCNPIPAVLAGALEPILNPIWVAIFYGEIISPMAFPGGVIVLLWVILYNLYLAKRDPVT